MKKNQQIPEPKELHVLPAPTEPSDAKPVSPSDAGPSKPQPPTIEELVLNDRKIRAERAARAIDKIFVAERVVLQVVSFDFVDGRLFPKYAIRAAEAINPAA